MEPEPGAAPSELASEPAKNSPELVRSRRFWRAEEREAGKPLSHFGPDADDDDDDDAAPRMAFFVHVGGASAADQQALWEKINWDWPMPSAMQDAGWYADGSGGSWLGAYCETLVCGPVVDAATLTQSFGMIEESLDKDVARLATEGLSVEYFISAGPKWDKK